MEAKLTVKDAMARGVITIKPSATIAEAAKVMNENDVGCLVVVENNRPVGIITDTDVLARVVSKDLKPSKVKVKDVMSTPLVTVDPDSDISEAARVMERAHIRRLPVMKNNRLVGFLSTTDLAAMCPVLVEYSGMAGERRELVARPVVAVPTELGICENCGTYTDTLYDVDGQLVCETCKEELTK
ncbi:MAG: CBS domain-containing protein [Euryarchaeota archaeon]|nr:CBS domain-containing protein [Euryarchaeota archaeon]